MTTQNDDATYANRRRTPRYPFVANAEFSGTKSGARLAARVNEIGLYGCYLDTPNPPPEGTHIFVKIYKETDFFESSATVAYSQPNRGMGIKFSEVSWHFLSTPQKWVLEAMRAAHD